MGRTERGVGRTERDGELRRVWLGPHRAQGEANIKVVPTTFGVGPLRDTSGIINRTIAAILHKLFKAAPRRRTINHTIYVLLVREARGARKPKRDTRKCVGNQASSSAQ